MYKLADCYDMKHTQEYPINKVNLHFLKS